MVEVAAAVGDGSEMAAAMEGEEQGDGEEEKAAAGAGVVEKAGAGVVEKAAAGVVEKAAAGVVEKAAAGVVEKAAAGVGAEEQREAVKQSILNRAMEAEEKCICEHWTPEDTYLYILVICSEKAYEKGWVDAEAVASTLEGVLPTVAWPADKRLAENQIRDMVVEDLDDLELLVFVKEVFAWSLF